MLRCETTARSTVLMALAGRLASAYSPLVVILSGASCLAPPFGSVTPGMGFPVNRRKADDPCRAHAMGGLVPWLLQTGLGWAAGDTLAVTPVGLWHGRAVRRPDVRSCVYLPRVGRLPLLTSPNHGAPQ
jgi:hypothetical protein